MQDVCEGKEIGFHETCTRLCLTILASGIGFSGQIIYHSCVVMMLAPFLPNRHLADEEMDAEATAETESVIHQYADIQ